MIELISQESCRKVELMKRCGVEVYVPPEETTIWESRRNECSVVCCFSFYDSSMISSYEACTVRRFNIIP